MIYFRCRKHGDDEWTELSMFGPMQHTAMQVLASGLAGSGSYAAQYKSVGGTEWIDVAEMDFDDGKDPE